MVTGVERHEIVWGNRSEKQVIFTFDGGATAESGEAILSALKKHNVKGTFFLTGKFVEKNQELVKKISHFDGCADVAAAWANTVFVAAVDFDFVRLDFIPASAND